MSKTSFKSSTKRKKSKTLFRNRLFGGLLRTRKRKKKRSFRQRCIAFFRQNPSFAGVILACLCGGVVVIGAWLGRDDRTDIARDVAHYMYEPSATRVEVDDPLAVMIENITAGRRPTDSLVYEDSTGPQLVIPSPLAGVSPLSEPEAEAALWRAPFEPQSSHDIKENKAASPSQIDGPHSRPEKEKVPLRDQKTPDGASAPAKTPDKPLRKTPAFDKIKLMAVVIDDMGIDRPRTRRVLELPGPLTVSFLTFARHLQRQARQASQGGHEVMLHIPMEPRGTVPPGPDALLVSMTPAEITKRSRDLLKRMSGFVGVNNHQGSRFTETESALRPFMEVLKQHNLFFLDSKTTGRSVGKKIAHDVGVRYVERHVFLDHEPTAPFVRKQLALAERLAQRHGYAIVIGHPKDVTINALNTWLPQLAEKGIALVPVSTLVSMRYGAPRISQAPTLKRPDTP